MILVSRGAIPFHRRSIILSYAVAPGIHCTQVVLGGDVALVCKRAVQAKSADIVAASVGRVGLLKRAGNRRANKSAARGMLSEVWFYMCCSYGFDNAETSVWLWAEPETIIFRV